MRRMASRTFWRGLNVPTPDFDFLARRAEQLRAENRVFPRPKDGDGGPPYDGGMEARVAKLEETMTDVRERLARIETRVEATATREDLNKTASDLYKAMNAQTWRIIGAAGVLAAAVYFIATHAH